VNTRCKSLYLDKT